MYPDSLVQPIRHDVHCVVAFVTIHFHDKTRDSFTRPGICIPVEDVSFSPLF